MIGGLQVYWPEVPPQGIRIFSVQAADVFSREQVSENQLDAVLENLQMATAVESPEDISEFPADLETTNEILNMSLNFLMQNLASDPNNPLSLSVVSGSRLP